MADIWTKGPEEQGRRGHTKKMFGDKIIWERQEQPGDQKANTDTTPKGESVKDWMIRNKSIPVINEKNDKKGNSSYHDNGWAVRTPEQRRFSGWGNDYYGGGSFRDSWIKSILTNKFLIQTLVSVLIFMVAVGIYDRQDPASKVASRAVKYLLNVDVNYEPIMGRIVKLVFPEIAGDPINPDGGVILPASGSKTAPAQDNTGQKSSDQGTAQGPSSNSTSNSPRSGLVSPEEKDSTKTNNEAVSTPINNSMTIPVTGTVIKKFGWVNDDVDGFKRYHEGIDIQADLGTKVHAALDGKVAKIGENNEWGKYVQLNHNNNLTTFYTHLDKIDVKAEQMVKEGDNIGALGKTGGAEIPHLHFEIRENGELIDPWSKLNKEGI